MDDVADALLRCGLARDQRLGPEPGDQRSGDDSGTEANGGPIQNCQDRIHGARCQVRRRVLLSSSIVSSCPRSSLAIGSLSALRSRVGVASMALPTEMTAWSGGC